MFSGLLQLYLGYAQIKNNDSKHFIWNGGAVTYKIKLLLVHRHEGRDCSWNLFYWGGKMYYK